MLVRSTSAGPRTLTVLQVLLIIISSVHLIKSETLTPPYFNLAEGKNITATATCGVDTEGPELFCKLIGANSDSELKVNVIQGQYCDVCDPTRPDKMHPPEFAVDGMETWWQSPPLSRGMKYNEVNLTIDLGQEFHVAYVFIKMANSPRPGLWVLEKSADYGQTYTPWQYFSDSPADCETYFGKESLQQITRDDSVICTTEYSKILPLEEGEIPISLLNKRPSANHYFNSTVLQEWTRATNVRLRFLRTKNLLGHLMSVARQDPTVTRRYFYSIKDISIGGRCMCNGHAQTCDIPAPWDNRVLLCNCKHHTCGAKCDTCCPGYEQKAWRQSKHDNPFSCEPCNCFQHSYECKYDKEVDEKKLSLDINGRYDGGGVCLNCQHNTEGINCNKCKPKYFRPYNKHWNETDVCQPCHCEQFFSTGNCAEGSGRCECRPEFTPPNCDSCSFGYYDYPDCKPCECFLNGTLNQQCSATDGTCNCLPNFGGKYCKECAPGYYNFPECKRCECDADGSISDSCDQITGNCTCKAEFGGKNCNQCKEGYFNYPICEYCGCYNNGTEAEICEKETGKCICKEGFGNDRCEICILGYYGFPDCKPCNCSKVGSIGATCSVTGKCTCLNNFAGRTCNQCSPGYYNYPECKPCNCHTSGSNGISCDAEGVCECHKNFAGQFCDECKEGYYNFPACEDCNCHPAGVVEGFAGCGSVPAGELCQCKERVEGRICDKCKPLYWNLHPNNALGCEKCNCTRAGVLGGIQVCDSETGQCVCKPAVVARGCSECVDGTYKLQRNNLFGCTDCDCDVGGSISNICNKKTGQCSCQTRVTGRRCNEPIQAHYFPTLYQYQYEVEDGHTPENNRVRYAYDENVFANYSWKGYAVFSQLQREVIQNIFIAKPSLYRMVFRFVNTNPHTVIGLVSITSDNPADIEQYLKVQFRNTSQPEFVTVSGETGSTPSPFVMNPGRWTVSIKVNESVLLDYFVLLPEDFYSATILNKRVEKPCTLNETDLCRHYEYPNITSFERVNGIGGYTAVGKEGEPLKEIFQDEEHLGKINVGNRVPLLNPDQPTLIFNISVAKPGPYVLVINYVTPLDDLRTHKIEAETKTKYGVESGLLTLYSCPYSMMCRQVIVNNQGGIAVYNVANHHIPIEMKSTNANVGIHSIYAVPYDQWSLDYIKPRPVCIRKDNECLTATFRNPPETKKIQFEQELEGEAGKTLRPIVELNNNTYVWLNPTEKAIDLKGKVPSPGYYSFVVHYFQPDHPQFDLDVIIQNGQFYEAKVPLQHCPSKSGCRSLVVQNDRNNKFFLTENFMITLKQPDHKNAYLDYLLVIPADLYSHHQLEEEDLDRTGEFISSCGNNHFNIDTKKEGFCRDSVFSITASHNGGARACECDFAGSLSFECEKFGGQCQCKPNIIGRQCKACKTGYYGFPDCRPCNCPSTAYCEPQTGRCVCPPHVVGERCDQCEPLTYGFDPIIGCEECKCHSLGVRNRNFQCDLLNGTCPCLPNVVGRACDVCLAGHYSFPYCESCECDVRGSTPEICDQLTAECFCKKYATGLRCDFCRDGTFNLQANNEEGCTECFCFGKSSRCTSAQLIKAPISDLQNWQVVGVNLTDNHLNVTELKLPVQSLTDSIGVDFTEFDLDEKTAYVAAPKSYLGKRLTSYGGYLSYKIFYSIGSSGSAVSGPDVILQGADTYLTYNSFEQPPPAEEYRTQVQFVESNFEIWPLGVQARREHIMEVLNNLQGIYLRATYWSDSITTRFVNILLDSGEEPFNSRYDAQLDNSMLIASVERCVCPPNYQGLSCEDCAPGYYRVKTGPHGGYCVPCQCNGHASECDVDTGVCLNCTHNTRGDHCELCNEGYHGSALAGTPMDCLICACPLPIASNNFAKACDVSTDGERISCQCREGYFGARCQSCAAGYYGRPELQGDFCKPCQCSGNINPNDPSSCDTVTGECLRCLNNTSGQACALCAPGYFGDAVNLKDCQACICDPLGTSHCDSHTGRCICKPNVVGEKCDRCEVEHYGFQSGQGCSPCECAEASESDQCEDATGQCKCKPGVAGRTCDACAAGYWNYTANGCVSCGCKSEYSLGFGCNALTGQCECLKGVVGEKCDQCPHRWAFMPDFGCHQCDSCTHSLLDDTDSLASLIDPIMIEFDSTQSGYFTRRRLDNMKEQLGKLSERFEHIDPKQIDLKTSIQVLEGLEQDSKNLNRQSNYSLDQSEDLQNKSADLQDRMEIIYEDLANARDEAFKVIDDIDSITFSLGEEKPEIEGALAAAEELLNNMKIYNLTGRESDADKELERVNELLKNVTEIKQPADDLEDEVDSIKDSIKMFNDKLDDLYNHTQYSSNIAQQAQDAMERSGKDKLKNKLENIEKEVEKSQGNLADSRRLLDNTSSLLDDSIGKLKRLKDLPEILDSKNNEFNSSIQNNDEELKKVVKMKPEVERHASDLSYRAEELSRLVSESKNTDDAIKAARAYQDIVQAVKDAKEAVEHAENNTNLAINELDNVNNRSMEANWEAQSALDKAHDTNKDLKEKLEDELKRSRSHYVPVKEGHNKNVELLNDIKRKLNNIGQSSHETAYKEASENADNAVSDVLGVKDSISSTYSELPAETDKAKMLPTNMLDVKRNIDQTEKQISEINEKLPPVLEALDTLPERQQNIEALTSDIKDNINKLNQQIELARDIANRIKIGMRFYPNTTLELRNPPNLEDLSTSTKITGYFRTPQQSGLIWYLGNPNGTNLRRTKSDDYMALILQNGYPVLKLDLGNGQEQIILKKYVADNNWYQFIIERVGHNAKLSIREELPDGQERITTEEKTLAGPYTIFNLDQEKSKLFVGSFPVNYEMQKGIDISSFDGEIDTLVIGDKPVSLWNFNHGYENNHGAMERNRLIDQPDNGFSFNGNGYLVLDGRPYKFRSQSMVQLHFKTYATEGLLFLAGKGSTFLALELRNGKIIYQYNLGKGTKIWPTKKTYNDGRWHKVVASRDGAKGKLVVDDEDVMDKTKDIQGTNLEPIDTVSFGGYPSKHDYPDVTQTKFIGCIHNVTIMGQSIDLRDNLKAYDITTVCPDKVAQLVSFDKSRGGYVGWDGLAISNDFKVTLKFKTKEKDGLIFYATNKEQSDGISLAINNGRLKVISQKTELMSKDTFNDSAWHVVSVIHNHEMLRVDFDDYGYKVTDHAPPQLYLIYGVLYVGGLPRKIQPLPGTVGSTVPFAGCIADLTVNGEVKNFANTTEKSSEYIDKCHLDATKEILTDVHKLPPLPPIGEFIPYHTTAPEEETEDPLRPHGVTRGDGGFDFIPDEKITIRPPERRPIATPAPPPGRPIGTVPPSTAKPPAPEGCALPLTPPYEPESLNTYRFGTQSVSRFEYKNPRGKFKKSFEFSLDLKTAEPNGLIFYLSDTMAHLQYVALYMKDGKLTYVFKGDRDPIVMTTRDTYNDDKWHAVQFSRDGNNGKLTVDDNTYIQSGERTHSLDVRPPFYLGGIKKDDYDYVFKNINTTDKFQGCIRNFLMNSKPLDITFKEGVIPCSDNVESGTYFGGGTQTYVKLKDKFKVGQSFNIKLEIKPRANTGLLISVYGKKDYFVLEMVNGNMTVAVENGKGKISATYEPSSKFSLCDGNWHSIQAIKSKNVVTLSVDNIFTNPRVGDHSATSTDTGGALFMGGHRLMHKLQRGVSPHPKPYVGCIRNVILNNDPVDLDPSMVEGDVIIGSCRTN